VNTALRLPLVCHTVAPVRSASTLADDVMRGLFACPRTLPPKYFYDERGSALFDQICNLPEYYPTRTEAALLARVARQVIERVRPQRIVEFGSGTSRKTRLLLDACAPAGCFPAYVPFDVCADVVLTSGAELLRDYGWLDVRPLCGDYHAGLGNLPRGTAADLYLFLGGTIGNFTDHQALAFLRDLRAIMREGDFLLLGADRLKRPDLLHAAYNDFAGITAEFNRNVLRVMNRELGANFDLESFAHYASYNPHQAQIEMHLVAMRDQEVHFAALARTLALAEGDSMQTEISRKFTRAGIVALLGRAGFRMVEHFEERSPSFSLVLAAPQLCHAPAGDDA